MLWLAREKSVWSDSEPLPWEDEKQRFFAALAALDALTHTGQLAMLRRMHGAPMKGESYARADIAIGRVGPEQVPAKPGYEFD